MPVYRYSCWDSWCTGLSPVISTLVYCHVIINHPFSIELFRHLMNFSNNNTKQGIWLQLQKGRDLEMSL